MVIEADEQLFNDNGQDEVRIDLVQADSKTVYVCDQETTFPMWQANAITTIQILEERAIDPEIDRPYDYTVTITPNALAELTDALVS